MPAALRRSSISSRLTTRWRMAIMGGSTSGGWAGRVTIVVIPACEPRRDCRTARFIGAALIDYAPRAGRAIHPLPRKRFPHRFADNVWTEFHSR